MSRENRIHTKLFLTLVYVRNREMEGDIPAFLRTFQLLKYSHCILESIPTYFRTHWRHRDNFRVIFLT